MLLAVEEFHRLEPNLDADSGHVYHNIAFLSELNQLEGFDLNKYCKLIGLNKKLVKRLSKRACKLKLLILSYVRSSDAYYFNLVHPSFGSRINNSTRHTTTMFFEVYFNGIVRESVLEYLL